MFVDEADIVVRSGAGGAGCVSFRREKFVPRGGPDGGNGGAGGSIYLVADPHRNTLVHFQYNPEYKAQRGRGGQGANKTGHGGRDLEIPVPIGTMVYDLDAEYEGERVPVADLTHAGERVLVAQGGRGGLGNAHFVSSTNRAPRKAQPGEPGEERRLHLELKLLADVGLVGYPNAGKSTLISRISAAHPKIADYPFTTLTPHLGVVSLSDNRSFVVADVPGLIEGAHLGQGLGHQFLRHVERTKVLVHLVDVSGAPGRDPAADFDTIRRELELYNPHMLEKPQIVVASKIDAIDDHERVTKLESHARALDIPFMQVSAVTGEGLPPLLEALWARIAEARAAEAAAVALEAADGDEPVVMSTEQPEHVQTSEPLTFRTPESRRARKSEPEPSSTEAPKHPGTEAPRHPGTDAPRHPGTDAPDASGLFRYNPALVPPVTRKSKGRRKR